MFKAIQKKVRKNYFIKDERLSWAPFPSFILWCISEGASRRHELNEILERICRYFGGETVSLLDAKEEKLHLSKEQFCEKGYYYGMTFSEDAWFSLFKEKGRVVVFLSKEASSNSIKEAFKSIEKENFFVFSEMSYCMYPYRVLSDLLFFITNHEAPVIIDDFLAEIFPQKEKDIKGEFISVSSLTSENAFKEAILEGLVLEQNHKLYRIN